MNPATGLPEFQEDYGVSYNYDVEAQPGGFYGGEAPTPAQIADIYPTFDSGGETYTTAPILTGQPTRYGGAFDTFTPAEGQPADLFQIGGFAGGDAEAQEGGFYGGRTPTVAEFARTQPGFKEAVEPPSRSVMERLGITEKDLPRLGLGALLTGGLTAQNLSRTRQAQQQAQASREELAALGRPYQQTGAQLRGAAERGELTPVNRQILNAARAQIQQGIANRGGVGVAQAQNQIADLTQRLIQNQFDLGLRVSNIGDQYAQGAIRTALQADRAIGDANARFYGQLGQLAAPFILGQAPNITVTPPSRTA
jgi:hypothetical protein